jgi:hypothetical protein
VEDEASVNRTAFAKPSVDPLDAALAELEQGRSTPQDEKGNAQTTEPEPDEDETTSEVPTAEDGPEDDDLEDDRRTAEANTPDTADEDETEDSQESRQRQRPADKKKASKTEAQQQQAQGEDSDDEGPPLSRKQRGKLIEELRQELEREQQERQRLESFVRQQTEADQKLNQEVDRALGRDEDFEQAMAEGLAGNTKQAEKARIWKANREFYKKLLDKSQRDTASGFMETYWSSVNGLPGVTPQALVAPNLASILKNMYDAGAASVKDSSTEELEKLKEDVETWKGRYRSLKAKAGSTKQSPLGGGGSTAAEQPFDWQKKYIDPRTGLLSDEADAIVARYGFEALMNPKLRKG